LNFDIRADYFKLSDNRVLTAFTIQTENKDLAFVDSGGLLTARVNILGRIVAVTERRINSFEDSVTTRSTVKELTGTLERKSAYSKVTILEPGHYRADVLVRDVSSGASGVRHFGFQVPRYDANRLATSSMILAARLENMQGRDASSQFVIGQTKVIPNLTGLFHRGQPVGVYLELYNAGIDQTTLRPSVDVEYALLKDGKEIRKQLEDWRGNSDSGQRLTLARLLETQILTRGDYEVAIHVHDRVSGQELVQSAKFTLVE
jgi:5-hydroxyisourate hydrolase-like protein (transthyretin family)